MGTIWMVPIKVTKQLTNYLNLSIIQSHLELGGTMNHKADTEFSTICECGGEMMHDEQFCKYCGRVNSDFILTLFNEGAPAESNKVYTSAKEARSFCTDTGEEVLHMDYIEHSDQMYEISPEDGRILFCPDCGKQIVNEEKNDEKKQRPNRC